MHKIFTLIRAWFAGLMAIEVCEDPLSRMSPRELADLPVHHPRRETCLSQ